MPVSLPADSCRSGLPCRRYLHLICHAPALSSVPVFLLTDVDAGGVGIASNYAHGGLHLAAGGSLNSALTVPRAQYLDLRSMAAEAGVTVQLARVGKSNKKRLQNLRRLFAKGLPAGASEAQKAAHAASAARFRQVIDSLLAQDGGAFRVEALALAFDQQLHQSFWTWLADWLARQLSPQAAAAH